MDTRVGRHWAGHSLARAGRSDDQRDSTGTNNPTSDRALSATTISGYVDTSAVWNPGTGNANPAPYAFNAGKQDGFNVNAVDVKIAKAEDDSQWAAGYVVELSYGPDARPLMAALLPFARPTSK
jgi:hypothetical protein